MKLCVGARASPLSLAQVQEVLSELQKFAPNITFDVHALQTTGDLNLSVSLRSLGQTNFFTKEIDDLLLKGICRIGIHSAKDLPNPMPEGLKIVTLTRGVDPSDSLVFREDNFLDSLPPNSIIGTSSLRREEAVRTLRADFKFCDVRGTIHERLKLLAKGAVDGIVIAEAALIRLQLTHLNRIRLPGEPSPLQGQLAVVAKHSDLEMAELFRPMDVRLLPKALYLGPEFPSHAFANRRLVHHPIIHIVPYSTEDPLINKMLQEWPSFTHLILTSKSAIKILMNLLRRKQIALDSLRDKKVIAVGAATAFVLKGYGIDSQVASEEQSEGVAKIIQSIHETSYVLWPHSALSRPVINDTLIQRKIPFFSCPLYDTYPCKNSALPDLNQISEVLFSSPSTVKSFFTRIPRPPSHLKLTPIGSVTAEELAKYASFKEN